MSDLPACIYVDHMCVWCPQKTEGGIRSPATASRDDCVHHVRVGNQTQDFYKSNSGGTCWAIIPVVNLTDFQNFVCVHAQVYDEKPVSRDLRFA